MPCLKFVSKEYRHFVIVSLSVNIEFWGVKRKNKVFYTCGLALFTFLLYSVFRITEWLCNICLSLKPSSLTKCIFVSLRTLFPFSQRFVWSKKNVHFIFQVINSLILFKNVKPYKQEIEIFVSALSPPLLPPACRFRDLITWEGFSYNILNSPSFSIFEIINCETVTKSFDSYTFHMNTMFYVFTTPLPRQATILFFILIKTPKWVLIVLFFKKRSFRKSYCVFLT